ncbi:prolyl oligopeptidase family serine peptidase [Rubripirellula amarantea]|nr:prolyl oligopeptidase family serine peptidase [Rubripirellula amarantea]
MVFVSVLVLACANTDGEDASAIRTSTLDLEYRNVDGISLKLDLLLPKHPSSIASPCVVFVHGGGWGNGDKTIGTRIAGWLTEHGFAVASIGQRSTKVAQWPAQIDDCYAAVRWVRDHASDYHLDPDRVGAWGSSSGGHLAALMGTRPCPDPETTSSRVNAVCDWFGPTDLLSMPANTLGNGRTQADIAKSNGARLLGATVLEVPQRAKDASALDQVSEDDAAFLIMHGDQDNSVPIEQSQKLHSKLVRHGVESQLEIIPGSGHGGKEFQSERSRSLILRFFQSHLMGNWPQGIGPQGNFNVSQAIAPTKWSVVKNENVRWRKVLPETGQSTVVTWGDRLFFTTMKPVQQDSETGSDMVAWCCNADTGETMWTRDLRADHPLRLSGCFGDSTSPPPLTDGQRVCFFNASGRIACFDYEGKLLWQNDMMPVSRTQPFLSNGQVVFIHQSYMPNSEGHFTHDHKDAASDHWTQLQALDIATGSPIWRTKCGVNMGCVPLPTSLSDGRRVILVGRGGGHSPPEKPDGISLVSAIDGSTIWTLPIENFMSTMSLNVFGDRALVFDGGDHLWIDVFTGKVARRESFTANVDLRRNTSSNAGRPLWESETVSIDLGTSSRAIIQQSNVLAGHYHYFRSYTQPWLGRVNVITGVAEYLQIPVQLNRANDKDVDRWLWNESEMSDHEIEVQHQMMRKPTKSLPIQHWAFEPNEMRNASGALVMGDSRSRGNGWGHHASAVPTVVGQHMYVPTMSGTVYVIRWNNETLDETSIIGINDLGPLGKSFNRGSLSYHRGRLYAHTIQELICLE